MPQVQLIRARLFPATTENPRTVFAFSMLDLLCQLSTQGKMSVYNFYMSMKNLTDNLDIESWPVSSILIPFIISTDAIWQTRYVELSNVIRRYKHLHLLKRFARGHDVKGVEATVLGELALDCPACPLPGRNMDENWSEDDRKKP